MLTFTVIRSTVLPTVQYWETYQLRTYKSLLQYLHVINSLQRPGSTTAVRNTVGWLDLFSYFRGLDKTRSD